MALQKTASTNGDAAPKTKAMAVPTTASNNGDASNKNKGNGSANNDEDASEENNGDASKDYTGNATPTEAAKQQTKAANRCMMQDAGCRICKSTTNLCRN